MDRHHAHAFPVTLREFKKRDGCALILSSAKPRRAEHLQLYEIATSATQLTASINLDLESAEQTLIQRTLGRTHGNAAEAARLLNIRRRRIYWKFLHLVSGVQKPPLPAAGSVRSVSFLSFNLLRNPLR